MNERVVPDVEIHGERQIARSFLAKLLPADGAPELGARVKQQLLDAFRQRGMPHPRLGKFSSFLAENSDLVEVIRDSVPGDMRVRRRVVQGSGSEIKVTVSAPRPERAPHLPPALWAALTNPDPTRRRFFSRAKNRIVHFRADAVDEADKRIRDEVERDEEKYVEVPFVLADLQKGWMVEFLRDARLPSRMREVFNQLLLLPYSSSLNYAFTASLGERAESWRIFRARRVHDIAKDWALKNGVPLWSDDREPEPSPTQASDRPIEFKEGSPLRAAIHKAIDCLSDAELQRVMIPATALNSRTD